MRSAGAHTARRARRCPSLTCLPGLRTVGPCPLLVCARCTEGAPSTVWRRGDRVLGIRIRIRICVCIRVHYRGGSASSPRFRPRGTCWCVCTPLLKQVCSTLCVSGKGFRRIQSRDISSTNARPEHCTPRDNALFVQFGRLERERSVDARLCHFL